MTTLLDERFLDAKLLTNEWAFRKPADPVAAKSKNWDVTSGSLYQTRLGAWSGVPDGVSPDVYSSNGTGSAVFRMVSKQVYQRPIRITVDIENVGLTSTSRTPPVAWDGLHIFCGYQDPDNLCAVTFSRRDNVVIIKKKKSGMYTEVSATNPHAASYGESRRYMIEIGSWISLFAYTGAGLGVLLTQSSDQDFQSGKVGLRADNCEFLLSRFKVEAW